MAIEGPCLDRSQSLLLRASGKSESQRQAGSAIPVRDSLSSGLDLVGQGPLHTMQSVSLYSRMSVLEFLHFLGAIASPSTYPCQWVSGSVIDSYRLEIAIASPSFASLFSFELLLACYPMFRMPLMGQQAILCSVDCVTMHTPCPVCPVCHLYALCSVCPLCTVCSHNQSLQTDTNAHRPSNHCHCQINII